MNPTPRHAALPCDATATRASLLARVRDWSDDASWQEFFETYWRLIYAMALRHGLTDSEAEEVVQCTVIEVAKNIRNFNYDAKQGSFRQWLIHQARWRIRDQQRKRQRDQKFFARRSSPKTDGTGTIERVADGRSDHELAWEGEWRDSVHDAVLNSLRTQIKPKHYQIFDLYCLRQWPADRVRRTLGVGLASMYIISSRVKRLYRRERTRIERTLARRPGRTEESMKL
jgi:RNA polymerase sigma-70 factor (ECF subfamily)